MLFSIWVDVRGSVRLCQVPENIDQPAEVLVFEALVEPMTFNRRFYTLSEVWLPAPQKPVNGFGVSLTAWQEDEQFVCCGFTDLPVTDRRTLREAAEPFVMTAAQAAEGLGPAAHAEMTSAELLVCRLRQFDAHKLHSLPATLTLLVGASAPSRYEFLR